MRVYTILWGYKGKRESLKVGVKRSKPLWQTLLIWRDIFLIVNYDPKNKLTELPMLAYEDAKGNRVSLDSLSSWEDSEQGPRLTGEREMAYIFSNSKERGLPFDVSYDLICQVKEMLCAGLKSRFKEIWRFYYRNKDYSRKDKIIIGKDTKLTETMIR